ncbi:MAG: glycosyltransferase [Paludibacter sp.]
MTKVLFISQWYPHRYDPMFGLFVRKHAEAVALYANVAVLYVHPDPLIKKREIVITSEHGFQEIIVYYPSSGKSIWGNTRKRIEYLLSYKKGFEILFDSWGLPEIIQVSVFTRTPLIAAWLKKRYKIPYTVIEHWTRYFREKTFNSRIHRMLSTFAARNADAVMPVTLHLQKSMENHGMHNMNYRIINNVVDDLFFDRLATPTSKKIRILNVTCFDDAQKNLSGLINVIQALQIKRQDFELVLVGKGIDFEHIKELAVEKGLDDKVIKFTGMLTGEELVKTYQESHFTVLFSNYENIPVVISESFACGLPVISTNVGGIAEHIDQSNGLLIHKGDEQALFNSIDYMLDHHSEYNSEEIRNKALERYSYKSVGKEMMNIYQEILKK